jgi:hypothetical protein
VQVLDGLVGDALDQFGIGHFLRMRISHPG